MIMHQTTNESLHEKDLRSCTRKVWISEEKKAWFCQFSFQFVTLVFLTPFLGFKVSVKVSQTAKPLHFWTRRGFSFRHEVPLIANFHEVPRIANCHEVPLIANYLSRSLANCYLLSQSSSCVPRLTELNDFLAAQHKKLQDQSWPEYRNHKKNALSECQVLTDAPQCFSPPATSKKALRRFTAKRERKTLPYIQIVMANMVWRARSFYGGSPSHPRGLLPSWLVLVAGHAPYCKTSTAPSTKGPPRESRCLGNHQGCLVLVGVLQANIS